MSGLVLNLSGKRVYQDLSPTLGKKEQSLPTSALWFCDYMQAVAGYFGVFTRPDRK
jgi:hypothetical protein